MLIPTRNRRRTAPRKLAAKQGPEAEHIEQILATPEGHALYTRRQQIIKPVFANTKSIPQRQPLQRRRSTACRAEWKLLAATHNLPKPWRGKTDSIPTRNGRTATHPRTSAARFLNSTPRTQPDTNPPKHHTIYTTASFAGLSAMGETCRRANHALMAAPAVDVE